MNADANQPKLNRSLKEGHILMITIGSIVGAGFFVGSSPSIIQAGPLVLIAYLISTLFMIVVTRSMATIVLSSQAQGSFLSSIGSQLGKRVFLISGWAYWTIWPLVMASQMLAAGTLLSHLIPVSPIIISFSLLVMLLAINMMSVDVFGKFQTGFSVIKLLVMALFSLLGLISLFYMYKQGLPFSTIHKNFVEYTSHLDSWWKPVLAVTPILFTTMAGTEIASIAAGESEEPLDKVVHMMTKVAIWVGVIYATCIFFILCFVPWDGLDPAYSSFLPALHAMSFPYAEDILAVVIFIAILSTLNASLYVSSRVLMEIGANNAAPKALGRLSGSNNLPITAMVFSATAAIVLLLLTLGTGKELMSLLLNVTGTFVIFEYLLVVISSMKFSLRDSKVRFVLQLATSLFLFSILASMVLMESTRNQALISFGALILIWMLGLIFQKKTA